MCLAQQFSELQLLPLLLLFLDCSLLWTEYICNAGPAGDEVKGLLKELKKFKGAHNSAAESISAEGENSDPPAMVLKSEAYQNNADADVNSRSKNVSVC